MISTSGHLIPQFLEVRFHRTRIFNREFENRVGFAWQTGAKSTSYDIVKQYAQSKIGTFTKQEALIACPSLGSSSVEAALKKLVSEGVIDRLGAGRQTHYVRNEE